MQKGPVLVLLGALLAGCAGSDGSDDEQGSRNVYPYYDTADGLYHSVDETPNGTFTLAWAPGALSMASSTDDDVTLTEFWSIREEGPSSTAGGVLVLDGQGWQLLDEGPIQQIVVPGGSSVTFIPPPHTNQIQWSHFLHHGMSPIMDLPASWNQIISGENMWDLEAYQEENFPHRTPGQENYGKSIDYFAQYFRDLGMDVEVDPYDTRGLTGVAGCSPVGLNSLCPESLANIVATKPGRDPTKVIFVAGGHYDMVPGTTHAAFDDTSGVVGTMELARALAPYEFEHTLMFGLWGGEENGILGSQFWVQSHPEMRARIVSYWNLDVIGMSWPAPAFAPSPLVISAGPDVPTGDSGETQDPVSESLLTWAETLQTEWLGFPTEVNGTRMFHYEGTASGQVNGYAAVNAQSDHTPFTAAGIPAYFIFNGDALSNPVGIHNERDTLANMTMVSWYGMEAVLDEPWPDPSTYEPAKQMLARSWETNIWFPFYHTILVDLGVYTPPAVAAQVPTA